MCIRDSKSNVEKDKENPFKLKKMLGELIITELFNNDEAAKAANSFENVTVNKNIPDEMEEIILENDISIHLPKFLAENGILKSSSEGRRLISSGGFKINNEKYDKLDINSKDLINKTIQIGKRNFIRIIKK